MKPDDALITARRQLLAAEVELHGQANIARKTGKVDRQIGDLTAGRASFGDRMARQLEPLLRPDLPAGWLVFANATSEPEKTTPNPKSAATEPTANDYHEEIIEHRAKTLAQQAADIGAMWMDLSPARREEVRDQLRAELGQTSRAGDAKILRNRSRTKNQDTGTN